MIKRWKEQQNQTSAENEVSSQRNNQTKHKLRINNKNKKNTKKQRKKQSNILTSFLTVFKSSNLPYYIDSFLSSNETIFWTFLVLKISSQELGEGPSFNERFCADWQIIIRLRSKSSFKIKHRSLTAQGGVLLHAHLLCLKTKI